MSRFALPALVFVLLAPTVTGADIDFAREVLPVLSEHCFTCHGPDAETREADLRLDEAESARDVLAAGTLVARLKSTDPEEVMPPPGAKALSAHERELLVRWVAAGAPYARHWAFVPPTKPALPDVQLTNWPKNPIDHFVLAKLEAAGLLPQEQAAPETLARRLALDLTGLPAELSDVQALVAADGDEGVAETIARLMKSPRYAERMAAPWLDLARYADTDGYQNDRYRYQHVWRDWVILAFASNMPYDQFLVEQLAGDMLEGATFKQQVATGFCRNHRINSEDGSIPAEWHVENVVDRVDTLGTALLGLTVGCARCHDHKYDPLTQKEYYQLFAYFNNVPEWGVGPNNGNSPPFVDVPPSWPNLSPGENAARSPDPVRLRPSREGNAGNGLKRPQAGSPKTVMVMAEMPQPRDTYRLIRGQYNQPDTSEVLQPGVPQFLASDGQRPNDRLALARWLVAPDHPLTARVAVNRLWQEVFGIGLVSTSENFGLQGEPPSHPELLDWLSVTLVESGWDLQVVLRLILTSATYQQASHVRPESLRKDPDNRLLSRGPRFRLPPFMLRDQALAVSGLLHEQLGGPSVKPYMPPKIWKAFSNNTYKRDKGESLYRRSLYTYWRRTIPPPTMMNFNAAAREVCEVRTQRTNTPLQALTLMNNVTFVEAARFLAQRLLQEDGDTGTRIAKGFQLLTARRPSAEEAALLLDAHGEFRGVYERDSQAAKRLLAVGDGVRDESLPLADHAAMTMVASLLLNLDEAVTKE